MYNLMQAMSKSKTRNLNYKCSKKLLNKKGPCISN